MHPGIHSDDNFAEKKAMARREMLEPRFTEEENKSRAIFPLLHPKPDISTPSSPSVLDKVRYGKSADKSILSA